MLFFPVLPPVLPPSLGTHPARPARPAREAARAVLRWVVIGGLLAGCKSEIGDQCVLSTDCSTRGDRLCDTSQPGGYCTQFNCSTNSCPDNALCVLFNSSIPGCGYDDRSGRYGSRVARAFCLASCDTDEDCRGGYVCVDPKSSPWNGLVQDTNQTKRSCMVLPSDFYYDAGLDAAGLDAAGRNTRGKPICGPTAPDVDPIDASPARIVTEPNVNPPLVSDGGVDAGPTDAGDGG